MYFIQKGTYKIICKIMKKIMLQVDLKLQAKEGI